MRTKPKKVRQHLEISNDTAFAVVWSVLQSNVCIYYRQQTVITSRIHNTVDYEEKSLVTDVSTAMMSDIWRRDNMKRTYTAKGSDPRICKVAFHCTWNNKYEFSLGSIKEHVTNYYRNKGQTSIICGCCGTYFSTIAALTSHVNQPKFHKRTSAIPHYVPSEFNAAIYAPSTTSYPPEITDTDFQPSSPGLESLIQMIASSPDTYSQISRWMFSDVTLYGVIFKCTTERNDKHVEHTTVCFHNTSFIRADTCLLQMDVPYPSGSGRLDVDIIHWTFEQE